MWLAFFLLSLLMPLSAIAAQQSIGAIKQSGTCVVAGVQGPVTINCPGIPPSVVRILNEQYNARLKDRDLRIDEITKDANDWKDKYIELMNRLAVAAVSDGLTPKAEELLKAGKLDEAGRVLDQMLSGGEKQIDRIAKNHFDRATLYELQFQPLQALPHYEKAYTYRSNNPIYGQAYADLLSYAQGSFNKAELIYRDVLKIQRQLVQKNRAAHLPGLALMLNNLSILYLNMKRFEDAYRVIAETIEYRNELAKLNRAANLPGLAAALDNLGNLYAETKHFKEADETMTMSLRYRRELVEENREIYLFSLSLTLNNLGILYTQMKRYKEADDAFAETLKYRNELVQKNRKAYLFSLPETLGDWSILYSDMKRFDEAANISTDAVRYWRELVQKNRGAYLPGLAMALDNRGVLYARMNRTTEAGGDFMEALGYRRELAEENRAAHLPGLAVTLFNLSSLYTNRGHEHDAAKFCKEVASILKNFSIDNPVKLSPQLNSLCALP